MRVWLEEVHFRSKSQNVDANGERTLSTRSYIRAPNRLLEVFGSNLDQREAVLA